VQGDCNSLARVKDEIDTILRFMKDRNTPCKSIEGLDDMSDVLQSTDYTRSVLAFCDSQDLDSIGRSSAGINPHNSRYIVAVCYPDALVVDDKCVNIDCWMIFETRYLLVDYFRKVIEHLLRTMA
jgi:hypothetical protein